MAKHRTSRHRHRSRGKWCWGGSRRRRGTLSGRRMVERAVRRHAHRRKLGRCRSRGRVVVTQVGSPTDSWLAARWLATLKAGSNYGHLDLITERVIDDGSEDDVRLFMRGPLDQVGGSRELETHKVPL